MSYGRDRDAHTRGIGAVARADHSRTRQARRRAVARAMRARDAQLAGLTYGPGGGLAGYGALEQLGAIKLTGSSMQSVRQPIINWGGQPEGPQPPPQRTFNPLRPNTNIVGPAFQPGPTTVPPLRAGSGKLGIATALPTFPVNTSIGPFDPNGGGSGVFTSGGSSSGGGTGVLTTSGGGGTTSGGDGAGGGIVTGGSSGPVFTPPPDPTMPDPSTPSDSVTIAGVTVPKTAMLVGGGLLAAYLLFGRKR